MDGNGRWASRRGLPRLAGHHAGTENVRRITIACADAGVEVLTIYAFSTENWRRPADEVLRPDASARPAHRPRGRRAPPQQRPIRHVGELEGIQPRLAERVRAAVELTRDNTGLVLNVAFNYGGRHEIARAVQRIMQAGVSAENLTEELIDQYLDTAGSARSRPGDPHRRRDAAEQLPAMAGSVCRVLFDSDMLARFRPRGAVPGLRGVRPASPTVRRPELSDAPPAAATQHAAARPVDSPAGSSRSRSCCGSPISATRLYGLFIAAATAYASMEVRSMLRKGGYSPIDWLLVGLAAMLAAGGVAVGVLVGQCGHGRGWCHGGSPLGRAPGARRRACPDRRPDREPRITGRCAPPSTPWSTGLCPSSMALYLGGFMLFYLPLRAEPIYLPGLLGHGASGAELGVRQQRLLCRRAPSAARAWRPAISPEQVCRGRRRGSGRAPRWWA